MKIEQIIQSYNVSRCLRDALPNCEAELEILEEDENVKKYLKLKEHQKRYEHLKKQTDEDLLDEIIASDADTITEDIYFCYGKSFLGHPRKAGGYYIEPQKTSFRHLQGIRVAKYRNLANPDDIIIVPSANIADFENNFQTISFETAVPDEEYYEIRRNLYLQEIRKAVEVKPITEPTYFCLGKYYRGILTNGGRCILRHKNMPGLYTRMACYRNLDNPEDFVVIPSKECQAFEEGKEIVFYHTNNPEQDYEEARQQREPKDVRRLVKELNHE